MADHRVTEQRVTEQLRRTWARQREQFLEETLSCRAEAFAELVNDIALMDRLLALPLGAQIPRS